MNAFFHALKSRLDALTGVGHFHSRNHGRKRLSIAINKNDRPPFFVGDRPELTAVFSQVLQAFG
jgi:hypothetical protein